jgi:hypothetical protein
MHVMGRMSPAEASGSTILRAAFLPSTTRSARPALDTMTGWCRSVAWSGGDCVRMHRVGKIKALTNRESSFDFVISCCARHEVDTFNNHGSIVGSEEDVR